ncbi:MAG: hypothetical protein RMY30_036255 [Nostoc sp. CmiSLP01]|nr:hypothetical protein [Nostoc sp. CmiSLP01]MDZ8282016.1 hypothetical protein [Nostoc sp. ChiSLP01]
MLNFSLAPYTIRIKQKGTSNYLYIGKISNSGLDFLDIIHEYLINFLPNSPSIISNSPTDRVKKILKVDPNILKINRNISGRFRAGENGYSSTLFNITTDVVSYERVPFDVELIPYYFLMSLPSDYDRGIIIFQRFKNFGVKSLFFQSFNHFFNNKFSNEYTFEMNPLVPADLIRTCIRDRRIAKVRLIKQSFPRDMFDVPPDAIPNDEEFEGTCELVLNASKKGNLLDKFHNRLFNKIEDFLDSNDTSVGSLIEVKNFDYDNIKIEARVGHSMKTIDLSNSKKIRYYEDISGIDIDTDGHPKFDIIDTRAKAFLSDLSVSIWGADLNA